MPEFLSPEAVRFEVHDGRAVLRLAIPAPPAASADGWSLLNRATMCILDGPDDAGYLLARVNRDGTDAAPPGWDQGVAAGGGIVVMFTDTAPSGGLFARLIG